MSANITMRKLAIAARHSDYGDRFPISDAYDIATQGDNSSALAYHLDALRESLNDLEETKD